MLKLFLIKLSCYHDNYFQYSMFGKHNGFVSHAWFTLAIDHLRNRQNFDINKSRQKFHYSLKEHHKISNIPKFRCEML